MELLGIRGRRVQPRHAPGRWRRVEPAEVPGLKRKAPAQLDRTGAALFERGIVQERVRLAVQDLVGEHRRLGRVDEMCSIGPDSNPCHHLDEPVDVHGLVQAVIERLAHEHVVGDDDGPGRRVLLARGEGGKDRRP